MKKVDCSVCAQQRLLSSMASTCEAHEPLVCKTCLRAWLKKCNTCPICRSVVHARAAKPRKRKRAEGEGAAAACVDSDDAYEAQFEAARQRAKERERAQQERDDHRVAVALARQQQPDVVLHEAHMNYASQVALLLQQIFQGSAALSGYGMELLGDE